MLTRTRISLEELVDTLKAAAESSRLRILALLSRGNLTVSDLTEILNQSQPRVSRHLKLLMDAGLIERYQEGSWAWFRLADTGQADDLVELLIARLDMADPQVERDMERLATVKTRMREQAAEYFARNAADWDELRKLHAPDEAVEKALLSMVGDTPVQTMLDIGTGTGRMLELFAPICLRATGIDASREMLAVARANLDKAGLTHAQVRQGDILALPVDRENYDLITIHQVLHYLDEPGRAIAEAARALRPGGRIVIVDFAPHALDFLREHHHHIRMGFSDGQIADWLDSTGLDMTTAAAIGEPANGPDRLTVKLWIGQDRRSLIADQTATPTSSETA
ncbi:MAG: ArsR family transcriptional regulator [Phyllobacteriaceae bacterium]|nr:ArsR family transcriptional regulator [Phyllobacteriaceae bacterium]MBA91121.1 ArsR family transcriptional regulator [Phyllobacteriaceae bacterium]